MPFLTRSPFWLPAVALVLATGVSPGAAQATPADETEIYVAAADLPVGTRLDRDNLAKFVTRKKVAKADLSKEFVTDEEKLADRRTTRAIRKGEAINPKDLTKGSPPLVLEGKDLLTLSFKATETAGFILPGSRIDVIATGRKDGKVVAFTLLENALVMAVETEATEGGKGVERLNISLAGTTDEALLVAAARELKLELSPVLRNPSKEAGDPAEHIKQVKKLLAEWVEKLPVAPAPRAKS